MKIKLSPSTLNLFLECPRCFWLHINKGIHRPRGIFPSLPGGMDGVIKDYYDGYRGSLPPEIVGKVAGKLFSDKQVLTKWRNWRTGLEYTDEETGATLFGALDDCLVDGDHYVPLDYKTRGSAPKEGTSEGYYGNQLNCYTLLLKENNYPVNGFGYLVYYYPKAVKENGIVQFDVYPVQLKTDAEVARKTFKDAVALLSGPEPKKHSNCAYCSWSSRPEEEFD